MNTTRLLPFAALALTMASPTAIYACRTIPPSPAMALRKADAVFVGTVVSKKGKPRIVNNGQYDVAYQSFEFRVEKAWKGAPNPTIVVATEGSDCGNRFVAGRQFLVFAYYHGYRGKSRRAFLASSIRSGTKATRIAAQDLTEIGPAKMVR